MVCVFDPSRYCNFDGNSIFDGNSFSFQTAPTTYAVVLGTFFGLAVVVFATIIKSTQSTRHTILVAPFLALAQSFWFFVGGRIGGDVSVVNCPSVSFVFKFSYEIILGFIYGWFLIYTICWVDIYAKDKSTDDKIRRIYLDSGIPLQGTVVQKSFQETFQVSKTNKGPSALHIRYDLRPYLCSRNNCQELELGAIGRSNTASPFGLIHPSGSDFRPSQRSRPDPQRLYAPEADPPGFYAPEANHSPGDFGSDYGNEETSTINPFEVEPKTYNESQIGDTVELVWSPRIPSPGDFGSNYRNEETSTINPFDVDRKTYNESQIGDTVELVWSPRIPFFVKMKSEVDSLVQTPAFVFVIFFFFVAFPFPLLLGFSLPAMILNWDICRVYVIVRMPMMVITAVIIVCTGGDLIDLTALRTQKIILEKRHKMHQEFERDDVVKKLCDAALTSLEKEVLRSLDGTADRTDELKLREKDLKTLIRHTLLQAKVSSGRRILNVTVVQ